MAAPLNVEEIVSGSVFPPTMADDPVLFGLNLFGMTAFTCLAVMFVGWMVGAIIAHWRYDKLWHPITIYRMGWAFAGLGLMFRAGGQAAALWSWEPQGAAPTVMLVKWYLDLASLGFAGAWLALFALSYPSMAAQLRKRPYPIKMLVRLPALKKPAIVIGLSFIAAVLVAWLKS